MTEDKNRFVDNGVGIVWLKQVQEATPHEKLPTEGTIIPHSKEETR